MNEAAALLAAVEIGSPLTRGPLALFPLFHDLEPAPPYLAGAASAGVVSIAEAEDAAVPELAVVNHGALPVLLLDGEALIGAKQNRIVTVTTVVPAHSSVPVSVTCVEVGRWGDERPIGRSNRHASSRIRAHNRASAVESGCAVPDQDAVWSEVERYATRFDAESATGAMEDVYAAATDHVGALVGDTRPLAGQCGVAAAVDGRVLAVDMFDSPATLADYWDALVAGYAIDADIQPAKPPRRRDVRRVLAEVARAAAARGEGRLHLRGERTTATAVSLERTVVHLGVSVA